MAGHCSCADGSSCVSAGKHPRFKGWQADATGDQKTIGEWWARFPNANIGGYCKDHEVLDIDDGGDETLMRFEPIPKTIEVMTPKGGTHLFFRPAPVPMMNAVKPDGYKGLDYRSKGRGFTVLPPSKIGERVWKFREGCRPDETTMVECPDWVIEAFEDKGESGKKMPKAGVGIETKEGDRNDRMFRFACDLRNRNFNAEMLYASLKILNSEWCKPPLPDSELHKIAESASTYAVPPELPEHEVEIPEVARCGWIGEFQTSGRKRGTPSGFSLIDDNTTTNGFPEGQIATIAAYTGVGKSAYMIQVAGYLAQAGNSVCFATFADLTAEDLYDRLVKQFSGWYGGDPPVHEDMRERWEEARKLVSSFKIYVYDAADLFTGHGIERFRDWFMQNDFQFSVVCVDYAQEIDAEARKQLSEYETAKAVCKVLRAMAGRTRIPFVIGSQVTEGKDGSRDITKGSRIWEEKAALVLKVKLLEGKELENSDYPGMQDLHLAHLTKNRFGPSNLRNYWVWRKQTMTFEEL